MSFCKRKTVVQDREDDIYNSFCMLQSAGLDFVILSNHDRKINASSGESLKSHVQSQVCAGEYILEAKGNNRRRRKRMVQIELRYEEVSLYRLANIVSAEKYP